jgi:hypothetical protein
MASLASGISSLQPEAVIEECPLHLAMDELARASVTQHVLYLEGECLPRPELLADIDQWFSIHSLVHNRICAASRTTPLEDSELESTARRIRLAGEPHGQSERLIAACAVCNQARHCPLGSRSAELTGHRS